jgi:prolipoprotein diacylglyceryltransferase
MQHGFSYVFWQVMHDANWHVGHWTVCLAVRVPTQMLHSVGAVVAIVTLWFVVREWEKNEASIFAL